MLGALLLGMGVVSPVLGGWASDRAARHDVAGGRLRLALAMFVAQVGVGAAFLLLTGLSATLVTLALNSLVSSCLAASAMVVLPERVPAEVRGKAIAIYLVATNVAGMGLGPLLVALLTDHVFADEAMVRAAIASTLAFTGALGVVAMAMALGWARRTAAG
jgi:MFS family permease